MCAKAAKRIYCIPSHGSPSLTLMKCSKSPPEQSSVTIHTLSLSCTTVMQA